MSDPTSATQLDVVTGAFGFSGKYIAERLLARGHRVRTLTNSPDRPNPFRDREDWAERLETRPYDFDDPGALRESLAGAEVFYNTYWVRFNHRKFKYADAVTNTKKLFEAAKAAGVRRVVHTSITNPSEDSPFEYFRGKAELEAALEESGLSYAILRPAVLFGPEDILINNIAWMLRKLPIFGVFGKGRYRLQPIFAEDFADLACAQGASDENVVIDAIGPETFTYRELARELGEIIGKKRPVIGVPPFIGFAIGWLVGKIVGDVVVTRDEIGGLMADLLHTDSPPAGETRLTDWARQHADSLGLRYASELARRLDRSRAYLEASQSPGGS